MNEFDGYQVTTADLDALRLELTIDGDQQTIAIDRGPGGGAIARMISPVAGASEASASTDVFTSSYDATADTYTLSWSEFTIWANWFGGIDSSGNKRYWYPKKVSTGSLVWDAAVFDTARRVIIQPVLAAIDGWIHDSEIELHWHADPVTFIGDELVGYDAATQILEYEGFGEDERVGQVLLEMSGSNNSAKAALSIDSINVYPFMVYFDSAYSIANTRLFSAVGSNYTPSNVWSYDMGNSFDDGIIVGWTASTDAVVTDALANYASYDDYRLLGYGKTDASGNLLTSALVENPMKTPFGFTGNWNDGTQTIYAANGRITKIV